MSEAEESATDDDGAWKQVLAQVQREEQCLDEVQGMPLVMQDIELAIDEHFISTAEQQTGNAREAAAAAEPASEARHNESKEQPASSSAKSVRGRPLARRQPRSSRRPQKRAAPLISNGDRVQSSISSGKLLTAALSIQNSTEACSSLIC